MNVKVKRIRQGYTLAFQIIMSTDLFAESIFLIGDTFIWSIFQSEICRFTHILNGHFTTIWNMILDSKSAQLSASNDIDT